MIRGKQRRRSYDSKKHEGEKVYVWELIVDEIELGPRPASDRDEDKPSSGSSLWS
jgi:hypothetical protein